MRRHYRILLIGIIILASFLRFYNFPYRYGLGEETIRDAVIGIEGARQLQVPMTGAFSSLGPFTFGPWYAYQVFAFSLLFHHPYAPWIYLSLLSVATVFLLYKIGELLYGKGFGLFLGFLAAVSPPQVISATHLTSHNMTNVFAALAVYLFLKIILKNVSYWYGFFLGLVIAIGMNLHFQMSGLLILPLLVLFYKRKRYTYFFTATAGVITAFVPLLFFELNNHWFNTRNIIYYLMYGRKLMYVPNRWLFYLRDFWPSFWADTFGIPILFAIVLIVLFAMSVLWGYRKKQLPIQLMLLFVAFLVNFIMLRYYWGPRFFGYLNYFRPFVFIFTALPLFYLSKTRAGLLASAGVVLLILYFSWPRNSMQLQKDGLSTEMYRQARIVEKLLPDKKFTVYGCNRHYRESYNAHLFSLLFVFDMDKKTSDNGTKVGMEHENCKDFAYKTFPNTQVINLSDKSEADLKKEGWELNSFSTIYNFYARWWFRLQP